MKLVNAQKFTAMVTQNYIMTMIKLTIFINQPIIQSYTLLILTSLYNLLKIFFLYLYMYKDAYAYAFSVRVHFILLNSYLLEINDNLLLNHNFKFYLITNHEKCHWTPYTHTHRERITDYPHLYVVDLYISQIATQHTCYVKVIKQGVQSLNHKACFIVEQISSLIYTYTYHVTLCS
jgi:hypothetical protein